MSLGHSTTVGDILDLEKNAEPNSLNLKRSTKQKDPEQLN